MAAALTRAERLAATGESGYIVLIFRDGGEKYLPTEIPDYPGLLRRNHALRGRHLTTP